jgi:uncharacterized protein DUF2877
VNEQLARLAAAGLLPAAAPPVPAGTGRAAVRARGLALLRAQAIEPGGAAELAARIAAALAGGTMLEPGLRALLAAAARADPLGAGEAGILLTGLGPGLTPLGDDLLVGAAAAMAVLGPAAGVPAGTARDFTARLAGAAREGCTTALSSELLELALRGFVMPPLGALLDLRPEGARGWRAALSTLARVGATSGRGMSLAAAAGCLLLAEARSASGASAAASGRG